MKNVKLYLILHGWTNINYMDITLLQFHII